MNLTMELSAQQLLEDLKEAGITLYLRHGNITTRDKLSCDQLLAVSKVRSEIRQILKEAQEVLEPE